MVKHESINIGYLRLRDVSLLSCFLVLIFVAGCRGKPESEGSSDRNYAVVAIEGDVDNLTPLFAEDVTAGEINELFYPTLTSSEFDRDQGILRYNPLFAKSWDLENNGRDLRFHLRTDATWSDGVRITAHDILHSYELYGDSSIASVRQGSLDALRRDENGKLDVSKAVEVENDSTVVFRFNRAYPGQMFDAGLPILPAHIFRRIDRALLRHHPINREPLSAGPFVLKSWKPLHEIVLTSNPNSSLPHPGRLSQLIFRVIPDYYSRLQQLKSGDVDVMPYVEMEDALELARGAPHIEIISMGERFYDAVNWNNIDGEVYRRSDGKEIKPHPLFGNRAVRRALTLAINRREIVETFLRDHGRVAFGPVSPLFRWAYNESLDPIRFDPSAASALLRAEGWRDKDGDGILEKGGRAFSFKLKIPAGNKLRMSVATVIQNQLRQVGIDVQLEPLERATFWESVMEKQFDACIAGFSVPLQMQLDEMWGSDLGRARFNLTSFRDSRVDGILRGAREVANELDHADAWKEFQAIILAEQPCTFLYWLNDLVAVNKRLRGTNIGVLGVAYHAGEWYVGDIVARALSGLR